MTQVVRINNTTTTGRDTLAADHDGEEITPYTQYAENYNE